MPIADRYSVLEDEPTSRLPVCILIDKSYSMNAVTGGRFTGRTEVRDGKTWNIVEGGGPPRLRSLLDGLAGFVDDISRDIRARASVELAVVSFGADVEIVRDFAPVEPALKTLNIQATGDQTRLGQGVKTALSLLDRRKKDYQEYGIAYYQPQLIILTDGEATDPSVCAEAATDVQKRMSTRKLICLPFLIGDEAGLASLKKLGPKGEVFKIDAVNLTALFKYLSQSASQIQTSQAGGSDEDFTLDKMIADLKNTIVRGDQF